MSNLNLKTPSALASHPTQQTIQIATKHPATLAATVFRPDTVKAAVMIAPATGIKRQFYQNFAQYLMEHGYGVAMTMKILASRCKATSSTLMHH